MTRVINIIAIWLYFAGAAYGQEIDLLIKNGHLIDPKNEINTTMDVAIKDGKIWK